MKKLFKGVYYQWIIFAIVVVAIVFVNIIGHFTSFRIDMTSDHRYSLADYVYKYNCNNNNCKDYPLIINTFK